MHIIIILLESIRFNAKQFVCCWYRCVISSSKMATKHLGPRIGSHIKYENWHSIFFAFVFVFVFFFFSSLLAITILIFAIGALGQWEFVSFYRFGNDFDSNKTLDTLAVKSREKVNRSYSLLLLLALLLLLSTATSFGQCHVRCTLCTFSMIAHRHSKGKVYIVLMFPTQWPSHKSQTSLFMWNI